MNNVFPNAQAVALNISGKAPGNTPDGRPLRVGMCTCSVHCPNHCEPCHCSEPWCDCWCHKARYDAMSEART